MFGTDVPPRPIAIVAGRISPEKGTAVAIRAARYARLEPWVVGEIYDQRYFRDQVEPLLANARFLPTVLREELRRMMAAAFVTLMPLDWDEPFGVVAAESQLAGCPVVGYWRGELCDVVEHGVSGYLAEPGDENDLVEGILHLDLLAGGWSLVYSDRLTVHHHPSPIRDVNHRRRLLVRNELWVV